MPFRSLVFDFDGTIADTLGEVRRIFNEIAPDYGIRQVEHEEVEPLRQLSLPEFIKHIGIPRHRVPTLISRGAKMMRHNITKLPLIEGMGETLTALRPHFESFGILTTNTRDNVELFLKTHGLSDHFDFISSRSKLSGKSRNLKAILTTFSWQAEDMCYIGDELRDVKASQNAGIPIAAVTWGFNAREALQAAEPDYLFDKPEELLSLRQP